MPQNSKQAFVPDGADLQALGLNLDQELVVSRALSPMPPGRIATLLRQMPFAADLIVETNDETLPWISIIHEASWAIDCLRTVGLGPDVALDLIACALRDEYYPDEDINTFSTAGTCDGSIDWIPEVARDPMGEMYSTVEAARRLACLGPEKATAVIRAVIRVRGMLRKEALNTLYALVGEQIDASDAATLIADAVRAYRPTHASDDRSDVLTALKAAVAVIGRDADALHVLKQAIEFGRRSSYLPEMLRTAATLARQGIPADQANAWLQQGATASDPGSALIVLRKCVEQGALEPGREHTFVEGLTVVPSPTLHETAFWMRMNRSQPELAMLAWSIERRDPELLQQLRKSVGNCALSIEELPTARRVAAAARRLSPVLVRLAKQDPSLPDAIVQLRRDVLEDRATPIDIRQFARVPKEVRDDVIAQVLTAILQRQSLPFAWENAAAAISAEQDEDDVREHIDRAVRGVVHETVIPINTARSPRDGETCCGAFLDSSHFDHPRKSLASAIRRYWDTGAQRDRDEVLAHAFERSGCHRFVIPGDIGSEMLALLRSVSTPSGRRAGPADEPGWGEVSEHLQIAIEALLGKNATRLEVAQRIDDLLAEHRRSIRIRMKQDLPEVGSWTGTVQVVKGVAYRIACGDVGELWSDPRFTMVRLARSDNGQCRHIHGVYGMSWKDERSWCLIDLDPKTADSSGLEEAVALVDAVRQLAGRASVASILIPQWIDPSPWPRLESAAVAMEATLESVGREVRVGPRCFEVAYVLRTD